jgi:hypothetical protein
VVDSGALWCPHCGAKLDGPSAGRIVLAFAILFLMLGLYAILTTE